MPLVNPELTEYLTRVVRALDTDTLHPDARRTNRCPECDEDITFSHDPNHLVWARTNLNTNKTEIVVIVACEEYWVIDPNLVGIDKPQWTHPDDPINPMNI